MSFSVVQPKPLPPPLQNDSMAFSVRSMLNGQHKTGVGKKNPSDMLKNKTTGSEVKRISAKRSSNRSRQKNLNRLDRGIKSEMTLLPFQHFRTQIEYKQSSAKRHRNFKRVSFILTIFSMYCKNMALICII
jgi:hypothetical protein